MRHVLLLLLAAPALAAGPATRPSPPSTPAEPREMAPLIDSRQPAFVPKFARVDNPPAGQFEERQYAYRFGTPVPVGFGYACDGYFGFGFYGYGGADWGRTTSFSR